MSHHTNIVRIKGVYHALGDLGDQVVFVGGATVSLYADHPDQIEVRPTHDIDILIELGTYRDYAVLQQKLFALGFEPDISSKLICRFKYQGLIVDIIPVAEHILGFSNKWYREGFEYLIRYTLDQNIQVNIFTALYFIASKLEAFKGRGRADGRTSSDFEDIVFVLDNRKTIWEEMGMATPLLKQYFIREWNALLRHPHHEEWLSAHLEYATASLRAKQIISSMTTFTNTASPE